MSVILDSVITCPSYGTARAENMPTDACQFYCECTGCKVLLKPKPGDCCVFLLFRFRTLPADSTGAALCVSVKALAGGTLPAPDGADNHPPCRYAFFDGVGQVVKPNGK